MAFFYVSGKKMGGRRWDERGRLFSEWTIKDGLMHGLCRYLNEDGSVNWDVTYFRGRLHGLQRQYGIGGRVIGACRMRHGTGADLWFTEEKDGRIELSEERYFHDGRRHGFERWWEDQHRIYAESHFVNGTLHGIHREWNAKRNLRRGFPKYFVNDEQVTKRQYLQAAQNDASLPQFNKADNRPQRTLPLARIRAAVPSLAKEGWTRHQ
jgi:hypothetical protein